MCNFNETAMNHADSEVTMRELNEVEMQLVDGGMSDFTSGGMAVIGLGLAGGPVTAGFGLAIGGAMMIVGHFQKN